MKQLTMIVLAFIMGFVIVTLLASTASAQDTQLISINDYYDENVIRTSVPVESCKQVDIPVYKEKQGGDDLGAFLGGAIIGGVIGNNVGNVDGGGALGAIIGGAIANENSKKKKTTQEIVGYKRQTVCETTKRIESKTVREYSHTIIKFNYQGRTYEVSFTK